VTHPASDLTQVAPHIFLWQQYDPAVKADLSATALETETGTYLIDPIPLSPEDLLTSRLCRPPIGILVTNINHVRATNAFASTFSIPVYANKELCGSLDFPSANWITDGEPLAAGLTAISIEGGPPGETALYHQDDGGTVVVGDSIINFGPYGLSLLPRKYCEDFKRMQRSLRTLLDYRFERVLFAHGTPIVSGGFARLERLLGACSG
jgi:glyoxylase-like metal-dependent hydrolase (beta-lactamase superfamily II)